MVSFSLAGSVVAVTGASGNLGSHFVRAVLEAGARVAMLDVVQPSGTRPHDLASSVGGSIDDLLFVGCDVTDDASVQAAGREVEAAFGVPTGLVNCAAVDAPPVADGANPSFESFPSERFREIVDVNLQGVVRCCQVLGGMMARQGGGSIVNVASHYAVVGPDQRIYRHLQDGDEPFFKPAAYISSKAALIGLTRYLAVYWADRGVRVNTLTPGGVRAGQDEAGVREYEDRVPLGRMARADEYDGAVVFMLSDASSYMTGANLVIDGGFTAW